jgi:hypothetical protein
VAAEAAVTSEEGTKTSSFFLFLSYILFIS